MARSFSSITVSGRNFRQGGSLLVINDDRRVELDHTVGDVRTAMRSKESDGFLSNLDELITTASNQSRLTLARTRRLVLDVDQDLLTPSLERLIGDLAASLECEVSSIGDRGVGLEPGDVILSMYKKYDYLRLTRLEDLVAAADVRWCPFWRVAGGACFGPIREDAHSPTARDLAGRWISAAPSRKQAAAVLEPEELVATSLPFTAVQAAHEHVTFLRDVWSWLSGGAPPLAWWRTVRIDRAGALATDPVLPLPHTEARAHPMESRLGPMDVVSTRTGIVTRLRPITFRSPMPPDICYVESQTADMSRLQSWASNIYNAGSSWGDDNAARAGAVGEAIERYCGNVTDLQRLRFASYDEIVRDGIRALDPRQLVLFSDEQYANPRFPFVKFDRDLRTHWVRGHSLVDESEVHVPAALASSTGTPGSRYTHRAQTPRTIRASRPPAISTRLLRTPWRRLWNVTPQWCGGVAVIAFPRPRTARPPLGTSCRKTGNDGTGSA